MIMMPMMMLMMHILLNTVDSCTEEDDPIDISTSLLQPFSQTKAHAVNLSPGIFCYPTTPLISPIIFWLHGRHINESFTVQTPLTLQTTYISSLCIGVEVQVNKIY